MKNRRIDSFSAVATNKGFALVRVLGKDMKPENMSTLIEALQRSNIDEASLGGLKQFF